MSFFSLCFKHSILRCRATFASRTFSQTTYNMAPKSKKHARTESNDDPALKHPSPKRAKEIDADPPYQQLEELLEETQADQEPRNVLHWFRSKDIRQEDNIALNAASQKAQEGSGSLITLYLHSPKDVEWHGTSPARMDFILESLKILKKQLEEKNIPLAIVEVEERNQKTDKVMEFVKDNDVSHIFANYEYEVDELRRDISVAKRIQEQKDLSFEVMHDQTVVKPLELVGGGGGPIKVFTPYHKAWLAETKENSELFDTVAAPEANEKKAGQDFKKLFESMVPDLPESHKFDSQEEQKRVRKLWPAGHHAGMERLQHFLNKKVKALLLSSTYIEIHAKLTLLRCRGTQLTAANLPATSPPVSLHTSLQACSPSGPS